MSKKLSPGSIICVNRNIIDIVNFMSWPRILSDTVGLVGQIYKNGPTINIIGKSTTQKELTYYIKFNPSNSRYNELERYRFNSEKIIAEDCFYPQSALDNIDDGIPNFRYSEKVIVSTDFYNKNNWRVVIFRGYSPKDNMFITDCGKFKYCVKFKGNEHLLI